MDAPPLPTRSIRRATSRRTSLSDRSAVISGPPVRERASAGCVSPAPWTFIRAASASGTEETGPADKPSASAGEGMACAGPGKAVSAGAAACVSEGPSLRASSKARTTSGAGRPCGPSGLLRSAPGETPSRSSASKSFETPSPEISIPPPSGGARPAAPFQGARRQGPPQGLHPRQEEPARRRLRRSAAPKAGTGRARPVLRDRRDARTELPP